MSRLTITAVIVICAAIAAAVGLLEGAPERGSVEPQNAAEVSPVFRGAPPRAASAGQPAAEDAGEPKPPPTDSTDDLVADIKRRMAESVRAQAGGELKERLVASGLSPTDSDEIVRRLSVDLAECSFAAARLEAEEQSLTFDEFLYRLEGTLQEADINLADRLDTSKIRQRAFPCILNASQRAGIPLSR